MLGCFSRIFMGVLSLYDIFHCYYTFVKIDPVKETNDNQYALETLFEKLHLIITCDTVCTFCTLWKRDFKKKQE